MPSEHRKTPADLPGGLWEALAGRLDFSRYVPRPLEPAEAVYVDLARSRQRRGPEPTPPCCERPGFTAPRPADSDRTAEIGGAGRIAEPLTTRLRRPDRARALVLKSPTGRYVQLSDRDEFLWRNMDGRRAIRELVLLYFHEFESFAFDRISILLRHLREAGLLEDPPVDAFQSLRSRLERGRPSAVASRLAGLFVEHRLELRNLDRIITFTYRCLFWPFFTKPAFALYVLLCAAGTFAFVKVLAGRDYLSTLLGGDDGTAYAYGALTLLLATVFLIVFHQAAHIYAAKSRGREVPSAGFIISRGLPFFYAETTDIWLENRFARIMVSMAGTVSDVVIGSAGGLYMYLFPESAWNPLVFKLSLVSYGALLMDLNPLFELDAYYALSDYLEIPDLRERSLRFIRKELRGRLGSGEPLGRDERVYAAYGLLSAAWMVVVGIAALGLMGYQAKSAVSDVLEGDSAVNVVKGIVVLVFFVIPLSVAVLAFAALAVWKIVSWLRRKAALRDSRRLLRFMMGLTGFACVAVLAVPHLARGIVALPAADVTLDAMGRILPPEIRLTLWSLVFRALVPGIALATAAVAFLAAREVAGSRLGRAFRYFAAFLVIECARAAWEAYSLTQRLEEASWQAELMGEIGSLVWLALEMAVWAALAMWSAYLVLRVELRLMPHWRKAVAILAAVASVAGAVAFAVSPGLDLDARQRAKLAFGLSAAVLAVVNLIPTLINYSGTLVWWGWALVLAGVGARALAGLGRLTGRAIQAGVQLDVLGAVLLLCAMILFRALFRRMSVTVQRPERAEGARPGDRARLVSALAYVIESLAENLREAVGQRSVVSLERTLNRAARREGRAVRLEKGRFEHGALAEEGILRVAEEGRWAISLIEREASSLAGSRFFRRLMTAVYDQLYWSEREPVYEHVLRGFPWADEIARLPRPEAGGVEALIEASPLFEGLGPQERSELASRMRPRSVPAGRAIVREGDPADAFFLVSSGEFEVFHEDAPREVIARLARGDYFGETAAEPGSRRGASVRAGTEGVALELSGQDFGLFVRAHVSVAEKFEQAKEVIELLRRMPAFRELPLAQVALVATAMRGLEVKTGDVIVRQGEPGTALYVIRSGELEVVASHEGRSPRRVATLGPGEYFGEIALIESVPRTATVRALSGGELLALEKEDFDRRVGSSLAALAGLRRVSSRRRREIAERRSEPTQEFVMSRGSTAEA